MAERLIDRHNLKREVFDLREQLAKEGLSKDEIDSIIENASLSNFYAYRNTCRYPWHLCFSYFDFNVKTTKSVDIAVIDDIEYDDEWLCKVWGKCLYDLFGEEDMELSFYTGLYNIFTTLDEKERLKELNYISHCPASHIKIGESKFRNLALLSYSKGCCGGRVELPFGSYKYRPAAREKVDEMERQLKAYCEDLKNS